MERKRLLRDTSVREVKVLLGDASVRIIGDSIIQRAATINDFDMFIERLRDLAGYMDNMSEFDKMKEETRIKSMDAVGVLFRTGYI